MRCERISAIKYLPNACGCLTNHAKFTSDMIEIKKSDPELGFWTDGSSLESTESAESTKYL